MESQSQSLVNDFTQPTTQVVAASMESHRFVPSWCGDAYLRNGIRRESFCSYCRSRLGLVWRHRDRRHSEVRQEEAGGMKERTRRRLVWLVDHMQYFWILGSGIALL